MEAKTGVAMELFLDPIPPAAGSARRALHSAAMFGAATEPDALLLLSELVTNSIVHAGHSGHDAIRVRAAHDGSTARVEVCDRARGETLPTMRGAPPSFATGGRGLLLVDALSDRWGTDTCERGTCVWFELED
jgi:anti-sigma regulatory factor (Ser/Thr protein kinase)